MGRITPTEPKPDPKLVRRLFVEWVNEPTKKSTGALPRYYLGRAGRGPESPYISDDTNRAYEAFAAGRYTLSEQ